MGKKYFSLLMLALILLTLPGCFGVIPKLDATLKLGANEAWDFEIEFHIPESIYYMGSEDLESDFESTQQEAEANGLDFDWKISDTNDEGNVVVTMVFSGEGYHILNTDVFESNSITVREIDGEQILDFNISTYGAGLGEFFLYANESTFLLEGGEILSTNGTKLDNNSVIWYNPSGVMSAEMKLPGANILPMIFIVGGLFLIGIAVYKLAQKSTVVREPAMEYPQAPPSNIPEYETEVDQTSQEISTGRFCIHCGHELPSGAKFCIKCGKTQQ